MHGLKNQYGGEAILSVVIITHNEEDNIRGCLESIKWADEIIIVDSFSSDKTTEIAREYTDKIIKRKWEGYGAQKQFGLKQATCEWVLSLDADERVSHQLKDEILSTKLDKDAYRIPFKFFWLGRELRFGGCGREKHLRLFKRKNVKFTQSPIHEDIVVDGKIGSLKNPIIHLSYRDITDYFTKFNQYSTIEAQEIFNRRKSVVFTLEIFTSMLDFLRRYVLKLGFLDGMPGFLWASFSSFHRLVKYAKLWEMQRQTWRK